jgi:hypothetical protein
MDGCATSAAKTASADGCAKSAAVKTASADGCAATKSAAIHTASVRSADGMVAAGGGACCKGDGETASGEKCDESATTAAIKDVVDEVPYAESKRVVVSGTYACGHCTMKATEDCTPMFKTADGKVYPLLKNNLSSKLRSADEGNGLEIATSVKKIDGVKYLEVKSYKVL